MDAPWEESPDAGMHVKAGDVLERLPTIFERVPEVDASLIFSEMSRLCKQAKVIFNRTFTRCQVEVIRLKREKALLTEQFEKERAQLRKELRARDFEVSELKWREREISSERDSL
ncbi:uncharacterized protein LOC107823982 [Nicotiana tabacum]|uniref:Uncharacterized protein LOC107823982 n=1 Tax=Nicotiana tabacum TaxID=4097 RepID=A0A1S4CYG1_TOBAC|nr:PREDICTED: uncharacterized protein LOC107823982 [Nicotiana tabacum]